MKKSYIAVGEYYGKDYVKIGKFDSSIGAKDYYENNFADPVVMELSEFKKLYTKALKS